MKTIATINFKGGVGKTTIVWCLGDVLSNTSRARTLLFDLDAQMSLTHAVAFNEGAWGSGYRFTEWYDSARGKHRTIFDAILAFAKLDGQFKFDVSDSFIYRLNDAFHFVPSDEQLYWLELRYRDVAPEAVKPFVRNLLDKISGAHTLPQYDYALFDCPPSFLDSHEFLLGCHVANPFVLRVFLLSSN